MPAAIATGNIHIGTITGELNGVILATPTTMDGRDGHVLHAIPLERTLEFLGRWPRPSPLVTTRRVVLGELRRFITVARGTPRPSWDMTCSTQIMSNHDEEPR